MPEKLEYRQPWRIIGPFGIFFYEAARLMIRHNEARFNNGYERAELATNTLV
jgi:hypothetical protein